MADNHKKHFIILPPHPGVDFDEALFLNLLEGSISLSIEEKQNIAAKIPQMTTEKVQKLIRLFEDEAQQYKILKTEKPSVLESLFNIREKEVLRSEIELDQIQKHHPKKDS